MPDGTPKVTRIPAVLPDAVRDRREVQYVPFVPYARPEKPSAKKVELHDNGCMTKVGKSLDTYGFMHASGRTIGAHRIVFCLAHHLTLPQIKGLHVHHRCANPGCINPAHLMLMRGRDHTMAHGRFALLCEEARRNGVPAPKMVEPLTPDADLTPKPDSE